MTTWEKWYKAIDENQPVLFINKNRPKDGREPDKAEVVNLVDGGDIVKPASEVVDWFEQRFLAECGIGNVGSQVDKKGENLIRAEVHSSDDVTEMITTGLVDYINNQLESSGVLEMPGCENLRCIPRKRDDNNDDILTDAGSEENNISGYAERGDEGSNL